jgi:hypothetical protein
MEQKTIIAIKGLAEQGKLMYRKENLQTTLKINFR